MTGATLGEGNGGGFGAQGTGLVGEPKGFRQGARLASWLVVAALFVGTVSAVCACKKADDPGRPVATLADTTAAARAFERIRIEWARNDAGERVQFRRELDAFAAAFPSDPLARLARVYAVLSLMDPPADWAQAEHRLDKLPLPPPGSTQDLYIVAFAKIRRYHHQPEVAFELLRPLAGGIVGPRARALLQEEIAFDALESRQPYEAIAYMDAWLRGASEDERQASEAKVSVALGGVPEAALRGSLAAMRGGRAGGAGGAGGVSRGAGPSHGYGEAIQRLVGERLGQIAIERGDAALARWLLDQDVQEPVLPEEVSGSLGQLATSRRGIGSVAGRTVGLVLPTSSNELRDEVADVLRGVLWALDLGRDDAKGEAGGAGLEPVRLVTRDDGGDPKRFRTALEEVAGEGATVIITALDPDTAEEALAWAATTPISTILLATPSSGASGVHAVPTAFSVGEDWDGELRLLSAALDTAGPVVTLGDTEAMSTLVAAASRQPGSWRRPVSCDVTATQAGQSRFPLGTWASETVHAWLVGGSPDCAGDLLSGLRKRSDRGVVALTFEASETDERPRPRSGLRVVSASAGIVPLALASPSDPRVRDARTMALRTGAPEGWWTAVGHDAAALASKALAALPPDTVSDPDEIARRRGYVTKGLVGAKAALWTSDQEGFGEGRVLARGVRVVELGK